MRDASRFCCGVVVLRTFREDDAVERKLALLDINCLTRADIVSIGCFGLGNKNDRLLHRLGRVNSIRNSRVVVRHINKRLPRLLLEHDVRNSLHIDAVACLELKLDILLGVVVHHLGAVEDGSIGGCEVDKLCAGSRLGCGNNRTDGKFAASAGNRPGESLESGNRVGNRLPYATAASIDCKGSRAGEFCEGRPVSFARPAITDRPASNNLHFGGNLGAIRTAVLRRKCREC